MSISTSDQIRQEVLVVDGDEKVQRGLSQLLSGEGLTPTVLADPERARALAREKFFAAALVDLDTPQPGAGLELVRWLRHEAPATQVLVMASRKVFEAAVEAFRAGAADVVVKAPDQVAYLKQRVLETASHVQAHSDEVKLLAEVSAVHEDFLRRLMETSRRACELEERLGGGSQVAEEGPCTVLLVEPPEDAWLGRQLAAALEAAGGFALTTCGSGGEGLDRASAGRFQIALISQTLPDLPGTMVVNALKGQTPETITILYTRPGKRPGKAEVIEGSRAIPLVPEFSDARQMLDRVDELRRAYSQRSRERRYLAAFRQENYELLKRYAELKQRIQRFDKR